MIKVSTKIVSLVIGVASVGTISVAASVTLPVIQPVTSSQITSSNNSSTNVLSSMNISSVQKTLQSEISSSAVSTKSSKEGVSDVETGIDRIQEATDEGVSRIKDETEKAVKTIKDNVPSVASHTITASGYINVEKTSKKQIHHKSITGTDKFSLPSSYKDNLQDNFIVIPYSYSGTVYPDDEATFNTADGLKQEGFKLLDSNNNPLEFTNGSRTLTIKVPFANISDISTMYLKYQDQTITIKVS
jgi:hypothetical protein